MRDARLQRIDRFLEAIDRWSYRLGVAVVIVAILFFGPVVWRIFKPLIWGGA
jgi:hypothetical protein